MNLKKLTRNQLIKEFKKINYLKGKLVLELKRRNILDFCICCNKSIIRFINNKYCSSCAVYTIELRRKVSSYRIALESAKIKLYGISDGRQRIR